ncbi:hypothetical protein T01_9676 [Trichinella spiralis]|uniref:Uncharacterized protein n=1 Tax=Trichinella spiralis TaxID=6334 RepID=A0A0V1ARF5_TRISP|nr:hypothetical protein T01_9676 [Trichinella spiralis]
MKLRMAGAYSEASLRQNEFSDLHDHRYIRIHLEQPPPNIHNGQGHCVMRIWGRPWMVAQRFDWKID